MSGNSQQENTLRKREKERAGEREEGREREREPDLLNLWITNLHRRTDGRTDGWWKDTGSEARGPRRGRIRQRGERQRKRERARRESIICSRLREMGRRSECEWMMR